MRTSRRARWIVRISRFSPFQSLALVVALALALLRRCADRRSLLHSSFRTQVGPGARPVGSAAGCGPEITTIRTYSNLVVVDVVVTDSQGNPVHGLKASDFTLTENNKPQTFGTSRSIARCRRRTSRLRRRQSCLPGCLPTSPPAPVNGPVNVLLLDYLNTPLTSQPYARKQLLDYLDNAPPGTRIAIFGLTTQLIMLQGFTSDMAVLKAALNVEEGRAAGVRHSGRPGQWRADHRYDAFRRHVD